MRAYVICILLLTHVSTTTVMLFSELAVVAATVPAKLNRNVSFDMIVCIKSEQTLPQLRRTIFLTAEATKKKKTKTAELIDNHFASEMPMASVQ